MRVPDQYAQMIAAAAARYGVPADLLARVIQQESGFDPNSTSRSGAIGIAQFKPETANDLGVNPRDPASSIDGAAHYLSQNYQKFGDFQKAVAAYNWGPNNVAKWVANGSNPNALPAETRNYLSNVFSQRQIASDGLPAPTPPGNVPQQKLDIHNVDTGWNFGKLDGVKGMVIHHTGGRGDVNGLVDTLNNRGLGVQFAVDRDGSVYQLMPDGAKAAHILPGWGKTGSGLSNANTLGVEVIAKNNADVTPQQVRSVQGLVQTQAQKYGFDPKTSVWGHGEVNPGHKEADEGMAEVSAIRNGDNQVQVADLQPAHPSDVPVPPERPSFQQQVAQADFGSGAKDLSASFAQPTLQVQPEAVASLDGGPAGSKFPDPNNLYSSLGKPSPLDGVLGSPVSSAEAKTSPLFTSANNVVADRFSPVMGQKNPFDQVMQNSPDMFKPETDLRGFGAPRQMLPVSGEPNVASSFASQTAPKTAPLSATPQIPIPQLRPSSDIFAQNVYGTNPTMGPYTTPQDFNLQEQAMKQGYAPWAPQFGGTPPAGDSSGMLGKLLGGQSQTFSLEGTPISKMLQNIGKMFNPQPIDASIKPTVDSAALSNSFSPNVPTVSPDSIKMEAANNTTDPSMMQGGSSLSQLFGGQSLYGNGLFGNGLLGTDTFGNPLSGMLGTDIMPMPDMTAFMPAPDMFAGPGALDFGFIG